MDDKDNKLSNLDKPLTTWELMKETADSDELKELKEIEKKDKHMSLQRKTNISKEELKKFWEAIKQH